MKYLILFLLFSCANQPVLNQAVYGENLTASAVEGIIPSASESDLEGFKTSQRQCSFLRTLYLDLSPAQSKTFLASLRKRIEPKTILGLNQKKERNKMNPCSRIRLYKSLKDIRFQGSKDRFGERGFLAKVILGEAPTGEAYLKVELHERFKKNETVRVMNPGLFLSYEKIREMTNDELADWIVSTLYHIAWK